MDISESFDRIYEYAHFWNWGPDWLVVKDIYQAFPNSYSVLTPFAYTYLEELIRSRTSEYGRELLDEEGKPKIRRVGLKLINLAIAENTHECQELLSLLEELKSYFSISDKTDMGDNRNSVVHGYMHPRFWSNESFEKLIYDIARLSKFADF